MSISSDLVTLNSAITQLMRVIRGIDDSQGMGRARLSALAVLHFGGSCSLTKLAQQEMVSRATMHHVVAGLEREGLILRKLDSKDSRRQQIVLTKRGTATILRAHKARIDFLQSMLQETSRQDLSVATKVLSRIRDNALSAVSE